VSSQYPTNILISNILLNLKDRCPESLPYWDRDVAPHFATILDLLIDNLDVFDEDNRDHGGSEIRLYLNFGRVTLGWFRLAYHDKFKIWQWEKSELLLPQGTPDLLTQLPWIICKN
jgi:hypothetical protein